MPRPRYRPGDTVIFGVKLHTGRQPSDLANYLGTRLGVVANQAKELLALEAVKLDGVITGKEARLDFSQPHQLEVTIPANWPRHLAATPMELQILYADDWLVALDKPPGIVTHPARGHLDGYTLQNGVRHHWRHLIGQPGTSLGAPHRLDKDTSGVVLFALRREAYSEISRQFSQGETVKEYIAILAGETDFCEKNVSLALGYDSIRRQGCPLPASAGGKEAKTHFRTLAKSHGVSLVQVVPQTGRPHQIRLHAASLGFPLLGDQDYNPEPWRHGGKRQALHARRLTFKHPWNNTSLTIQAPLPNDILSLLPEGLIAGLPSQDREFLTSSQAIIPDPKD